MPTETTAGTGHATVAVSNLGEEEINQGLEEKVLFFEVVCLSRTLVWKFG
jgi:hypothetical protein